MAACSTNRTHLDADSGSEEGPDASSPDRRADMGDGGVSVDAGAADAEPFRISISVSPFTEAIFDTLNRLVFNPRGTVATYTDGTRTATSVGSLEDLYIAHGANEVYVRISTARGHSTSTITEDRSLARGLERARLAVAKNLALNPELGLWGTYGDVGGQPPPDFHEYPEIPQLPGPWSSLTLEQMIPTFRAYGALVATEILATGARVEIWDIGNEVDFGVAGLSVRPEGPNGMSSCGPPIGPVGCGWTPPDGVDPAIGQQSIGSLLMMHEADRIAWLQVHLWPHEAKILAAVADGVRSMAPEARFATHVAGLASSKLPAAFYEAIVQGGFKVDVAGFSFYPAGPGVGPNWLTALHEGVDQIHASLHIPSFIAETAYPAGPVPEGPFMNWDQALPAYPLTEEGQYRLYRDLASWGASGALTGIRPWNPEGIAPGWAPMGYFKVVPGQDGNPTIVARRTLEALADGSRSPDANALQER
jgi:glycosyl hydrolase family 53